MSWQIATLGDITNLKRGFDLPKSRRKNGCVPIYSSSGISGSHDISAVDGPCVITGRYGTIGEVFYSERACWPLNTSLYSNEFKGNNPKFVYYLLKTVPWGEYATASAVPGINRNHVNHCPVLVPDKRAQDSIASILSSLDDKIKLNQRTNDYLAAVADVGFDALIAAGTKKVLLPQVIDILSGGTPKTKEPSYWDGGDIPFFGPGDVGNSTFVLETEKHITELGLENCNSGLYPKGTVFLTARGTVGKVAVAGRPMAMNQSCFALLGVDWIPQTYVYQVIKNAVKSLKAKANGATFAAINTRDLRDELIPIPPRKALEAYDGWARPLFALMLTNEEESLRLTSLRDAILPKLMSGEIDISKVELSTPPNNHLYAG